MAKAKKQAAAAVDINHYDVIVAPHITEKSTLLSEHNAVVFKVAGGAGGAAALLELPGDDTVQDVGARLDAEHLVIELQVGALAFAVEALNLDLHD